ncbi:hypothetical protein GPA10_22460 [Streptomyces sp. p1417]|uniref:Uncharacterized protein n=1 Tax=Streptomyces typhae TaxID=2681492 RepID=A0A6L6X1D1_9ACTN|nr:hypothetical protein [Streptomyces typhae]MVO87449.1 hypothetical protein [Streptomyces typhae]
MNLAAQTETALLVKQLSNQVEYLTEKVDAIGRSTSRRERIIVAAEEFGNVFDDSLLAQAISDDLSDHHLDSLMHLLAATGHRRAADTWESFNRPDTN